MKIYKINSTTGYFDGELEVPDETVGIPLFTTRTVVPEWQEGQYAVWAGSDWFITTDPPPTIINTTEPTE